MAVFVRCEMIDGSKWDVPLEVIAENYKANHGDVPVDDETLLRWADEMPWYEVAEKAVMKESPRPDHELGWLSGRKTLIKPADPAVS